MPYATTRALGDYAAVNPSEEPTRPIELVVRIAGSGTSQGVHITPEEAEKLAVRLREVVAQVKKGDDK